MLRRKLNVKNIETIHHISKSNITNKSVNIRELTNLKRIPRISFYDEDVDILEKKLYLLNPVVIRDHIITLYDLINISKYTQSIIVNINQVYNNLITFKKGRGLFRYVEISYNDENTKEIYDLLTK